MTMRLSGFFLEEPLLNPPTSTERLTLLPELDGAHEEIADGTEIARQFSAGVPESWPPSCDEPPVDEAVGWKRFYLSEARGDGQKQIVGIAGIGPLPADRKAAHVAVALVPECQEQGLGGEVIKALGEWVLSQPQFDLAISDTRESHATGVKCLLGAGYVQSDEHPADGYLRFVMQ